MQLKYLALTTLFLANLANANLATQLIEDKLKYIPNNIEKQLKSKNLYLSKSQLIILNKYNINTTLLKNLLIQILNHQQYQLLPELFAIYLETPQQDKKLSARIRAAIAKYNRDYKNAIKIYQNLVFLYPEDIRIQLDLAATLSEDKQWKDAQQLFSSLIKKETLPPEVIQNIQLYLFQLDRIQEWKFNIWLSPNYEKNINNAPERYCNKYNLCSTDKAKKGLGIHYGFSGEKNWELNKHFYSRIQSILTGTNYYLAKLSSYDHLLAEISSSIGWHDFKQNILISLLYHIQFNGSNNWQGYKKQNNHTFNISPWFSAFGLSSEYNYSFKSNLKSTLLVSALERKYRLHSFAKKHNGWYLKQKVTISWKPNLNTLLYTGFELQQTLPKNKYLKQKINNAAYFRTQLHLGWINHWKNIGGINSHINLSLAKKYFKGKITTHDFTQEKRIDKELQYSISFWHNKIAWRNLIPQITYTKQKIISSHYWANRNNHVISVELTKSF